MCKFVGDPAICLREEALAQKFTDRRTDDGRRAIALAHSWNELKTFIIQPYCIDNIFLALHTPFVSIV